MASRAIQRRVAAAAVFLATLTVPLSIACRHYLSARANFERAPVSFPLDDPQHAGVGRLAAISFASDDGVAISAWYCPSRNGAAIILAHGTNADRSSLLPELRFLASQGFGVLAYDGPGYGLSGGAARWGDDAQAALRAAVNWLVHANAPNPVRIGALGLSMGGYVLLQTAASEPRIEALVLEAVPPEIVEVTRWQNRQWGPLSEWPALAALRASPELLRRRGAYSEIPKIAPRPVLLISGDRDDTVPLFMTESLFGHAGNPKDLLVIAGAGHGRYTEVSPEHYPARVVDFFRSALLSGGPSPSFSTATR